MKQEISILGCGWLGMELALNLVSKGFIVKGSTTSNNKLQVLKSAEVSPYLINLNDLKDNISEFLSSEILIIAIPPQDIDDFIHLISQIEISKVKKVLFVSSTSVYDNLNQIVTEKTPVNNSLLSSIEQLFTKNSIFETTIIRFSGLFGYNRKPGSFFKGNRIINNPEGFVNFIHRDDCIQIINKIIEQNVWNETLNACADTHPTRRNFYSKETLKVGREAPIFDEVSLNTYKIVSNKKLKSLLDYSFIYPDLMDFE